MYTSNILPLACWCLSGPNRFSLRSKMMQERRTTHVSLLVLNVTAKQSVTVTLHRKQSKRELLFSSSFFFFQPPLLLTWHGCRIVSKRLVLERLTLAALYRQFFIRWRRWFLCSRGNWSIESLVLKHCVATLQL